MNAPHRFTKFAGTALVAGGLGLVALATAGTAGAISSANDNFLAEISAAGITYDSPRDAVLAAHDVCSAIDEGADPVDLGMEILEATDLTDDQVAVFVVASVDTYCPEHGVLFE
ncbi:DUF732 domain-containing protein [Mycobacterium sp.]|uniref:DUF732 domain-containing protein n=1 Tax=Mycobacterium sp. TaxID=1785 RepID=UPI002D98A7CB|nr:DUF732 domain-containing protein [Mycobacterium sp.]